MSNVTPFRKISALYKGELGGNDGHLTHAQQRRSEGAKSYLKDKEKYLAKLAAEKEQDRLALIKDVLANPEKYKE